MDVLLVAGEGEESATRLAAALTAEGHDVRPVGEADAELALRRGGIDVVVVTTEAAAALARRVVAPATPVVRSLASASSDAVAEALAGGVDEAVHPGMGSRELVARVERVCRHGASGAAELGALRVDPVAGEASWRGKRLALTRRERELLHALAAADGRPVRREALYRQVWGYAMPRGDRTVDVNVRRLRAKLADAEGAAIETEPGVGYRLVVAPAVTTL